MPTLRSSLLPRVLSFLNGRLRQGLATALLTSLAATFTLGCRAQTPATQAADTSLTPTVGQPLPLALSRRVEVLLRQKAQLPPGATITVSPARASELPGYDTIDVAFSADGKSSHPITFLLSQDGRTLAQFTKFDISADPRTLISDSGRPARGGPSTAPVVIVGFDDLECPFCARMHETLFPAITQRYGDKVHIVYHDFPLDQHPWAMRAAVDVNCLAAQSPLGYWNLVDYIHAHASEIGEGTAADKDKAPAIDRANSQLDNITRTQGQAQHADMTRLDACIAKQDTAAIEAEKKIGLALNIDSTPTLYINGAKIDGALPAEYVFNMVDDALRAQGVTPPPPYVAPKPTPTPTPAPTAAK